MFSQPLKCYKSVIPKLTRGIRAQNVVMCSAFRTGASIGAIFELVCEAHFLRHIFLLYVEAGVFWNHLNHRLSWHMWYRTHLSHPGTSLLFHLFEAPSTVRQLADSIPSLRVAQYLQGYVSSMATVT